MKKLSSIVIASMVALGFVMLPASVVVAGDDPAEVPPEGKINTISTAISHVDSFTWENTVGTGYHFDQYRWYYEDWGWPHTGLNSTGKIIYSAQLEIRAWDVDYADGERDHIYADGTDLGVLSGYDDSWSVTTLNIPPALAATMLADGVMSMWIDIGPSGWAVTLDYCKLTVRGNSLPVAEAGPDQTVEQDSHAGATVQLDGSGSYDPDGDPLQYKWSWPGGVAMGVSPTIVLPLGTTTVTLSVSDGDHVGTDTVNITVVDTTPPTITSISASPNVLWPPNHKMVDVTITTRCIDICDPHPICRIVGVTSNEPENGLGDGDTAPDWEITGDLTLKLRAERAGGGDGRVYTIAVQCTDRSGNTTIATVDVTVPHDKR